MSAGEHGIRSYRLTTHGFYLSATSQKSCEFERDKKFMTDKEKTMDQSYLNLLEQIRDTLAEIKDLREDLNDLLGSPSVLENLERIRDLLAEVQGLQEEADG